MICRSLRVLIAVCSVSIVGNGVYGQPTPSGVAVVDLCPMPVFDLGSRDTMLTFMPDPTVQFFIRVAPANCTNPLAPHSVYGQYAVNRRVTRYGPFRVTGEQAQALRRWLIERSDSAESAPTSSRPHRQR